MEDKRLFTRVPSSLEVDLVLANGDELCGRLRNLSMRGLLLASDATPPVGLPCNVTVYLAGREHRILIEVKGQIARCENGGIGVRFVAFSHDAFDNLRDVLLFAALDPDVIEDEITRYLGQTSARGH